MKLILVCLMVAFSATWQAANAADQCKDVLINGVMSRTELYKHSFFSQILAAESSQKTDQQIDQELSHQGSMMWAGAVFGGTFNSTDIRRFIQELRTKLDIATIVNNEESVIVASGDPEILKAWSDCMAQRRGFSVRFNPLSPTAAVMYFDWFAYPVAPGVSSDTVLQEDVAMPTGVTVTQGQDCLAKGHIFRDRVPCEAQLNFDSGSRDLLAVANVTHGSSDAYLPPRRILVPERAAWKPTVAESEIQAYAVSNENHSKLLCATPPPGWSFVSASMSVTPHFVSGNMSASRCKAELISVSPTQACFDALIQPDVRGDNKCNADLHGDVIRWNATDGMN